MMQSYPQPIILLYLNLKTTLMKTGIWKGHHHLILIKMKKVLLKERIW